MYYSQEKTQERTIKDLTNPEKLKILEMRPPMDTTSDEKWLNYVLKWMNYERKYMKKS